MNRRTFFAAITAPLVVPLVPVFGGEPKVGDTISVRKPVRWLMPDGSVWNSTMTKQLALAG